MYLYSTVVLFVSNCIVKIPSPSGSDRSFHPSLPHQLQNGPVTVTVENPTGLQRISTLNSMVDWAERNTTALIANAMSFLVHRIDLINKVNFIFLNIIFSIEVCLFNSSILRLLQ